MNQVAGSVSPDHDGSIARRRKGRFLMIIVVSVAAGWSVRRLQLSDGEAPGPQGLGAAASVPAVERSLTPEQQQLAAIGFDIERQPSRAPNLTVKDSRGAALSLAELSGSWVLLEFWGISCEPCRTAMPALQRLSISEVGKHIRIVAVCTDGDDAPAAQAALSRIASGLTAYVDATGIGIAQLGVQALPMTWLIDPEGRVRATRVGSVDWDDIDVRSAIKAVTASGAQRQSAGTQLKGAANPEP